MSIDLRNGIVRILNSNNETAGTGFVLTSDGLIATCSHVVQSNEAQRRGDHRPEKVTIIFHATGEQRQAWVEQNWWHSSKAEDVVILRIDGTLPKQVKSLPLGSSAGTSDHSFSTFGFRSANSREGIWGEGSILGETEIQGVRVLQLRSGDVTTGFSGAPIMDELRRCVVGMVTSINEPDRHGRLAETFYATPTETLRNVCSVVELKDTCPYRGLEAFTEENATFFFGRQGIVEELVRSLRNDSRFLAVFGPSGCGKSSVVQAGLIPELRGGAVIRNTSSKRWRIEVIRPTDASFEELVSQLERYSTEQRVGQPLEHRAVIIDQFEELFVNFSQEKYQLIARLTHVLENSSNLSHLTLIIIMRNDFYPLFAEHDTLIRWMQGRLINIPSTVKRREVEDMVKKPAEAAGWRFEDDGLVQVIVNDAMDAASNASQDVGSSTSLPLLEFALTQLWDGRRDGMLIWEAYHAMGGVTGGLNQRAEEAYNHFEKVLRPLVRRIFTALVYLGDKNQSVPDTRMRKEWTIFVDDVVAVESEKNHITNIVQKLIDKRLLVASQDAKSGRVTVEIIHDALLKKWDLLRNWIAEKREVLIWRQQYEERVRGWATQRDKDKLLRGRELDYAEKLLTSHKDDLYQREQNFISKSRKHKQQTTILQRALWAILLVLLAGLLIVSSVALKFSNDTLASSQQHVKDQQTLLNSLPVSVTNLNDHGPGSLRDAIAQARPGGAVTFAKTLRGTIRLTSGELKITKNLTISGPGSQALAISGGKTTRVFDVNSNLIVSISNLTIRDGFTTQRSSEFSEGLGGGIYNDLLSTLALVNVVITENAADFGGGIYNNVGAITLTDSTISHNSVRGDGGGIDNDGTLTLTNSTVAYNTTKQDGGGIKNRSTFFLTNSTIAANTASGTGGGILNTETGSVININYSTIYGNTAQTGGGMTIESGTEILEASIVAGNSANTAPDILGTVTLYWPSLIQNTVGTKFSSGPVPSGTENIFGTVPSAIQKAFELGKHSIFGKSPLLGPLQNNSGQTQTYALLPGSPAIDQILPDNNGECGSNSDYPTDQRGVPRLLGVGCDLGAYEYAPS